jgi:hypothetical protein
MKHKLIISIAMSAITLALSCKKEQTDVPVTPAAPSGSTYSGTTDFFNQNAVAFQTFTVSGTTGGTFTGSHGTKFTVPPAAFVDLNSQPVTGTVTVKIKEVLNNKDMFYSKIITAAYGYPLLSAGMFDFEPAINGQKVKFAPQKMLTAELATDTLNFNMQAFNGIAANNNNVNWVLADSTGTVGGVQFNQTFPYSYILINDSIGWCNVDVFYSSPPDINITVNTLSNPNPDSTFACVWFTGFKAIWSLAHNGLGQSIFNSGHVKPVPVSLIAITISNGKIFGDIKTVTTLTSNGIYDLNMHEMTDAEFKSAIAALN